MKTWAFCSVYFVILLGSPFANAALNLGTIMPLGDSLTYGDAWTGGIGTGFRTPIPGGYRDRLFADLSAANFSFQFVGSSQDNSTPALTAAGQSANEGHPGYFVSHIANNLDGSDSATASDNNGGHWLTGIGARAAINPDITLLMIGTNDLIAGIGPAYDVPVIVDSLLNKIYALRPHTLLLVGELPPETYSATAAAWTPEFNSDLAIEIAKQQAIGQRIQLVDTYTPFLNADQTINSSLFFDGLHPNQLGYKVMGDAWASAIETSVPEPSSLLLVALAISCSALPSASNRRRRAGR